MGHQRLGTLPRSKLWRDVVELIDQRADVEEVAAATSLAAEQSMIDASQDATVQHAFYLMAKIPLAAREQDFEAELGRLGIHVANGPTLTDLVCGVMGAIDSRTQQVGKRSDYGEIAQLSAAEALYGVIGREMRDLFGVDAVATKSAIAGFATVKQFAVLARDFFARLTRRHINYYLSRELSKHVGPGRRFPSVREHRVFEDALDLHCREATRVIKEYSGEWLSKQNYEGGIDPGKNTCRWTLLGEAEAVHSSGERAAIIEVLRLAESGEMHILEIMAATGRRDRNALDQLLFKMHRDGELIRVKRGVYGLTPGKMGKKERNE